MPGIDYSGQRAVPRLDLGAAVLELIQQDSDFIGTKIFPIFRSPLKKAVFSAITRETLAQIGDTKRGTKGNYNRGSMGAKDKSFACEENGWENPLDDSERAFYVNDFDAGFVATKGALGVVMRGQESRIAGKLFDTSVFTGADLYTDVSGSAPWTTVGSDAIATIKAARAKVRANCGMMPNALIMDAINRDRLTSLTVVKDAIKYTARATDQELINALADLMGVKYIFFGNAIKNTAKEGKTFAGGDIWDPKYVSLAIVAENGQDLTQPAAGRTFLWTQDCPENVFVEQYRAEDIRSDVFRVRQHTDEKLIDPYFAHLIKVAA